MDHLLPLCFVALAAAGPDAGLARVGGVPTFIVGGKPHSGVCYSSYDTHPPRLEARAKAFGEAGCDIFNFVVELAGYGYSAPMWTGPGQYDFTPLDDRVHAVLRGAPNALFLPRIYLDAPPWWRAQNPGEMMILDNGSTSFGQKLFALSREGDYPSLASEKWRQQTAEALRQVIAHVEASDYANRVIGYQLSGQKTEEWYHWSMNAEPLGDYSPHMLAAFRRWLQARYSTDAQFQDAWHQPDITLATAAIPSQTVRFGDRTRTFRDPVAEAPVIDFHRFWQDIMADSIGYFAQVVKESTHRAKLVGAFYGYVFEFTELAEDAGHLALGKLLRNPDIDFIMAPSSYWDRNLPGKPYFRLPVASTCLHGKVYWNDFDQVSFKYYDKLKDDPNLKTWEYQMGLTRTAEEYVWMNARELGMALSQGVQLAHFDIHGGYYDDPLIMEGVRTLIALREQALHWEDRGSSAQVLVLMDEQSEHSFSFRNPILTALLSQQIAAMPFVAPYDTALLSDLEDLPTARYKLVIVLNAIRLDAHQRAVIDRKLKSQGRTVVWLYAAGLTDGGALDVRRMTEVTGINAVMGDTRGEQRQALTCAWPPDVATPGTDPDEARQHALSVPRGQQFRIEDPSATPLATLDGEPSTVIAAVRDFPTWTSVYTAAAPLPAPVLKMLARRAGVHIWDDTTRHAVFAGPHCLTVCMDVTDTSAVIHVPKPAKVTDALTGEVVCDGKATFRAEFLPKEVRLFVLE